MRIKAGYPITKLIIPKGLQNNILRSRSRPVGIHEGGRSIQH
jgi:hypothetical protein